MQLLTKTIATSLTLILMLAACDGAQRDLESQIARSNDGTGSGQIETPTDQNGTVEMLPPSGGTVNDDNSTVGEIKVDAKNAYRVAVTFSDTYAKRGYFSRDEIGTLHFDITNLYTGTAADTKNIEEITLEAEEMNTPTDGRYLNFITFDGKEGPKYTIPSDSVKASDDVALKIKTLSGTTNIILKVTIAGMPSPYTLKIPVVIEKNKSSSMAIVPIDTRYENGLFIDKFVIHVVDSYGNKAKDGTKIYAGVINNPKLYSNALKENVQLDEQTLFNIIHRGDKSYFKNDTGMLDRANGSYLLPPNTIDTAKDTISPLDTLVILANQDAHKPENLGGWDIQSVNNDQTISLASIADGKNVTDTSYVIGDEYRYDACSKTLMNAAASSLETTDVKDGIAYAELRYVPAMVGKTIFIYANSRLNNKRIGISRKVTLKGLGLTPQTMTCDYKLTGPDCTMRWKMMLNGPKDTPAQNVYLEQPKLAGDLTYQYATASKTDCDGWTTVSIHGIDVNKTATVSFGNFIYDEIIKNKK